MIYCYTFKSPIGELTISEADEKIIGLSLKTEPLITHNFEKHSDLLYEGYVQLREYFEGKRMSFDLPVDPSGTEFQRKVWNELQNIPYGHTASYGDIALNIGNPKAARGVGQANKRNPVIIIIPCHRVIGKNGKLTGFAYGVDVKQYLLDLEKRNFDMGDLK